MNKLVKFRNKIRRKEYNDLKKQERKRRKDAKKKRVLLEDIDDSYKLLIPKPIKNDEIDMEMRPLMEQGYIPKPLHSVLIIGQSGSGKTTLLTNMLVLDHFYKGYFDKTYLFARSGKMDPLFSKLGIRKSNIFTNNFEGELKKIMKKQKEDIEKKGFKNTDSLHLIFDDMTAEKKFNKCSNLIECFCLGRHYKITPFIIGHKYKSFCREVRLNSSHIILFPAQNNEVEQLIDDFCPSNITKKELRKIIEYCFTVDYEKGDERPFLHVNRKCHRSKQFNKGFWCTINLESKSIGNKNDDDNERDNIIINNVSLFKDEKSKEDILNDVAFLIKK